MRRQPLPPMTQQQLVSFVSRSIMTVRLFELLVGIAIGTVFGIWLSR